MSPPSTVNPMASTATGMPSRRAVTASSSPLFAVSGRETHAECALYGGIHAHLLLARSDARILELNPGFSDSCAGAVTLPPGAGRLGPLKGGYDVTTPAAAWACFNVFTLEQRRWKSWPNWCA